MSDEKHKVNEKHEAEKLEVVVKDIEMSFGSVKWTLASVPALIILAIIGWIFWIIVIGITRG